LMQCPASNFLLLSALCCPPCTAAQIKFYVRSLMVHVQSRVFKELPPVRRIELFHSTWSVINTLFFLFLLLFLVRIRQNLQSCRHLPRLVKCTDKLN
jgi:hypothetical protein